MMFNNREDSIGRIVPVTVLSDVKSSIRLAEIFLQHGIESIEITLRTETALECVSAVKAALPSMRVGVGTVLTPSDAQRAIEAGAEFLVSPGFTESLVPIASDTAVPFIPGFSTVSEALRIVECGLSEAKFFPAEASGGVPFLNALGSVIPRLSIFPTGGITPENLADYLTLHNVTRVGGTWLSPQNAIAQSDWDHIRDVVARTINIIERIERHED
jgi:2-dehydro-3-deoxyphosphogluconate aldolase/(4S)-4-hydroxy-2-oxoglutarate aldolase